VQSSSENNEKDPSRRVYELLGLAESIAADTEDDWSPDLVLQALQVAELDAILRIVGETRQDMLELMNIVSPMLNNPATRFLRKRKSNG
jgi:hypothetical protein